MFSLTSLFKSVSILSDSSGSLASVGGGRARAATGSNGAPSPGALNPGGASGSLGAGSDVLGDDKYDVSAVIWYGVRLRILQRLWICMRAHNRCAVLSPMPKKCVNAYWRTICQYAY